MTHGILQESVVEEEVAGGKRDLSVASTKPKKQDIDIQGKKTKILGYMFESVTHTHTHTHTHPLLGYLFFVLDVSRKELQIEHAKMVNRPSLQTFIKERNKSHVSKDFVVPREVPSGVIWTLLKYCDRKND